MNYVSAPIIPCSRSTISRYTPISIDLSLPFHLHTRYIIASRWISDSTQSRPPSGSRKSHIQSLEVYLQTLSFMALKCISILANSGPPGTSRSSHKHGVVQWRSSNGEIPSSTVCRTTNYIQRQFMRKHDSGSRSIRRWPLDMKGHMGFRNHTYWAYLWKLSKSVWDQEMGKIHSVFSKTIWCPTTLDHANIYSVSLCPSPLSLYLHSLPPPPSHSVHLCYSHLAVSPPPASACQTEWWW